VREVSAIFVAKMSFLQFSGAGSNILDWSSEDYAPYKG